MKSKQYVLAMAMVFGLGVFTSCENTSIAEENELNELSIERKEIKNGDT